MRNGCAICRRCALGTLTASTRRGARKSTTPSRAGREPGSRICERAPDARPRYPTTMQITLAVLSLLGTSVFAASGALVAAEQRFDLIGATFLSVAAGLGGGTLVDLLIGAQVRWLTAPEPLWAALLSGIVVFEAVRFGTPPRQTLVWADAAGLALFTATGIQRLTPIDFDPAVTVFLTTIGAAGGGIVRDVLANRAPLVFSGEIY